MTPEMVVELGRKTMEATLLLAAPILAAAMIVSLVVNIVQVLTSVQEPTISTVPRLLITAGTAFLLMPWMIRHLAMFTVELFGDLRPYLQ
jgi:flagellar biosynthetic protein FliQ